MVDTMWTLVLNTESLKSKFDRNKIAILFIGGDGDERGFGREHCETNNTIVIPYTILTQILML